MKLHQFLINNGKEKLKNNPNWTKDDVIGWLMIIWQLRAKTAEKYADAIMSE